MIFDNIHEREQNSGGWNGPKWKLVSGKTGFSGLKSFFSEKFWRKCSKTFKKSIYPLNFFRTAWGGGNPPKPQRSCLFDKQFIGYSAFRNVLKGLGRKLGKYYILTATVVPLPLWDDKNGYDPIVMNQQLDFVNVAAFEFRGSWQVSFVKLVR